MLLLAGSEPFQYISWRLAIFTWSSLVDCRCVPPQAFTSMPAMQMSRISSLSFLLVGTTPLSADEAKKGSWLSVNLAVTGIADLTISLHLSSIACDTISLYPTCRVIITSLLVSCYIQLPWSWVGKLALIISGVADSRLTSICTALDFSNPIAFFWCSSQETVSAPYRLYITALIRCWPVASECKSGKSWWSLQLAWNA